MQKQSDDQRGECVYFQRARDIILKQDILPKEIQEEFREIERKGLTDYNLDNIKKVTKKEIKVLEREQIIEGGSLTIKHFEDLAFDLQEKDYKINKFIFDENDIHKRGLFPFTIFFDKHKREWVAGFGYFLTRNVETEKEIKNKKVVIYEQKKFPVLIASNNEYYELNNHFENTYNIKLNIPEAENYPLRWGLKSIKDYLQKKNEWVDPLDLYLRVEEKYKEYLYFQNAEWYKIQTLWDISTYFFLLFKYYPIKENRGLKGTGKSKTMTVSRCISFNASEELTNPTEATLFRDTENNRPTLYIDEAEKLFTIQKGKIEPDLRAELINSGYKYTGKVPRQEQFGSRYKTIYFSTYCPKMISSINGLYGATEDRAITQIHTKAPKNDDRSEKEPNEESEEWQTLRDDLYLFSLQSCEKIKDMYENFKDDVNLKDRDYWLWKPLFVIAKFIDEDLYNEIKAFAEKLSSIKKIDDINEGSTEYKIIEAIYKILNENRSCEKILIEEISQRLTTEYKPNNKTIARHLDKLGFRDYKEHGRNGNFYYINKELFECIISSQYPLILSSLSSLSSQSLYTKPIICEESVKEMKEKNNECEGNERSERSERNMRIEGLIKKYIQDNPSDNANYLDQEFPSKIKELKQNGEIIESPAGTYKLI